MYHQNKRLCRFSDLTEKISAKIDHFGLINVIIYGHLSSLNRVIKPALSGEEKRDITSFSREEYKENYILRRSILKILICKILGITLDSLQLTRLPNGRCVVNSDLFFSHSNKPDCFLYTFSKLTDVGADVEKIDEKIDTESIVNSFFSLKEKEFFFNSPEKKQLENFYRTWTMKEAIAKCFGKSIESSNSFKKRCYSFLLLPYAVSIAYKTPVNSMLTLELPLYKDKGLKN